MDDNQKAEYEARSKQLRADLKQWESEWAKTHMGKKPGREDIKANLDIAQKYKDYNKARDILAGKIQPPRARDTSVERERKRKHTAPSAYPSETPNKRGKHVETPMKDRFSASAVEGLMGTPAISRKLFSPASVRSMGPTPQRDGKVLGLFDLMVERELGTPSRINANGGDLETIPIAKTPSRKLGLGSTPRKQAVDTYEESSAVRLGRTPMSSSKRQRLDHFMTPLKNRDGNSAGLKPSESASKLQFDTPAFLKRNSLPVVQEHDDAFTGAVPAIRLPRKPLGRGLSEIVASLRKDDEDRLDAELDILREIEEEADGPPQAARSKPLQPPPSLTVQKPAGALEPNLLDDSQAPRLPLGGFDDEGMYDSPVEEGRNKPPTRVFKKKGQKRTTRRVNMRPVRAKRPTTSTADSGLYDDSDNDEDDHDEVLVVETQAGGQPAGNLDVDVGSASDWEDEEVPRKRKTKPSAPPKEKSKEKEPAAKKPGRKVNELAHANFHRLKLRNNGAKGGPGFNSKFRRRR